MKHLPIFVTLICFILVGFTLAASTDKSTDPASTEKKYRYPIAPGIWYPGDGPIPDKPMRYYRVRCWPGCHTGSSLGRYPDKRLKDKPIFPTSTIPTSTGSQARSRGLKGVNDPR